MKKTFTILLLGLAAALPLAAQIPNESPIPVDFRILSPGSIDGLHPYGSHANTWGDTLTQTVTGELVWAYSIGGDSLGCDSLVTDLTGKFAFIRRGSPVVGGTCFFSQKAWLAQQAGAVGVVIVNHYNTATDLPSTVYAMAAANAEPWLSRAQEVHIPAIFVSREVGELIQAELDAGVSVEMALEVRGFSVPRAAYSYATPQTGIIPLKDISASYFNLDPATLPEVTLKVDITDPTGETTTLQETINDVAGLSLNKITVSQAYVPDAIGEYNVVYTNSISSDTLTSVFHITPYTYAQDNDDIVPNTNGTIEPSDTAFAGHKNLTYNFGNFYRTGSQSQVATFATFMISNPNELFTGNPAADVFYLRLYDADPDGNGTVPFPASGTSYDILDESGGVVEPIATAEYVLSAEDQPFDYLSAEFPEPVTLDPNKIYLLMAEYNGLAAGIGIPPKYAFGGTEPPAGDLGSAIFTDSFRTDGWPGFNALVRLQLEGFSPSGTLEILDKNKIKISPNPVASTLHMDLFLSKMAEQVDVRIVDFMGRPVHSEQLKNVQTGTYNFDVSSLANGGYFITVFTPEGFRSKKFQVLR